MKLISQLQLTTDQAVLWTLGQAGCLVHSCGVTVVIDPYLSDSVGRISSEASRMIPVPIPPQELQVDLFVVTHDHLDHLDPDTLLPYRHKAETLFIAPEMAGRKLAELGIPHPNIITVNRGEERTVKGIKFRGIHAEPTEAAVADTTGYRLEFPNGRTLYHSSDTGFSEKLLQQAPSASAEVLLVCINGKYGNLNLSEAVQLTKAVRPRVVIPNHYDMMKINRENPAEFARLMREKAPDIRVVILDVLQPYRW